MSGRPFHQAASASALKVDTRGRRGVRWRIKRTLWLGLRVLLSPFRLYLRIRQAMTPASVSLLLVGILTLNIIWGYPWSGMFSACIALLFVGWAINRWMRPKLEIGFSLPRCSSVGQPFSLVIHARNRRRFPAMDLSISFADGTSNRQASAGRSRRRQRRSTDWPLCRSLKPPHSISLIQAGERIHRSGSLVFDRRGVHDLPDLIVISLFPFHLFRSSQKMASGASIAVTPRLMTGEEDAVARGMLDALGGWSHRLLSGDALDYTGSREYEVGMPVRRWDFASWARLGRPIVREFQSPTIQMVTLVIDTSSDIERDDDPRHGQLLERLLSLAATAVTELTRRSVRVGMFVTGPESGRLQVADERLAPGDCESLLIRLAQAQPVAAELADQQMRAVVDQMRHTPLLILTSRKGIELDTKGSSGRTVLRVDPPEKDPSRHSERTPGRKTRRQRARNETSDQTAAETRTAETRVVKESAA